MENEMGVIKIKKLVFKLGLPMIFSMILQALYNVVDSAFVANIKDYGYEANEALTYAFPIQILIIAIGVGTGVGLNTILSKNLGEKNINGASEIVGNGIFLGIFISIIFCLFGIFGSKWFISLFTKDELILEMGTSYLRICTTFSCFSIGYTIFERFLQATGKSLFSTIAQITGALVNIILDYLFIFPLGMGVIGAAVATVLGQLVSLVLAMFFHYSLNKEIINNVKYIKPKWQIIGLIYKIGFSAAIMQSLLSVMMSGMNKILSCSNYDSNLLVGTFGIYYKIQQIALFSCFGLSNTIITILSYNYGLKNKKRSQECILFGVIDTCFVALIITLLFELSAPYLAKLFALNNKDNVELINSCVKAIRISAISYLFMGFNIAIQGVMQALGYALYPLLTSFLRLVVFVFPFAILFTLSKNVINIIWLVFPIADGLTAFVSTFLLKKVYKDKILTLSA